jgi:hypothetical protein
MSALSNELFFNAHRGLTKVTKPTGALGSHWSASRGTADDFMSRGSTIPTGVIISAKIPLSSVETNTGRIKDVRRGEYGEQEITTKKNAPVLVTSMTKIYETPHAKYGGGRTRTRKYNPPREMKA